MNGAIKSKTILFNLLMAAIETLHASAHLIEPLFNPNEFIIVSLFLAIMHSVGGVYLRFVTTKPLSEK